MLIPGLLGTLESFNSLFRHPIEQRARQRAHAAKFKSRIRAFILRRGRDQVLGELPPKTEYTAGSSWNPAQADLYESLRTAVHEDIRRVIERRAQAEHRAHSRRLLKLHARPAATHGWSETAGPIRPGDERRLGQARMARHPRARAAGRRPQGADLSQFTSMLDLIGASSARQQIPFALLTGDTVDRDADRQLPVRQSVRVPAQPESWRRRPQPHRCRHRDPLRPVVEPGLP